VICFDGRKPIYLLTPLGYIPAMTKVAILPEHAESGQIAYRAIAGTHQCLGPTAGQALDALAASLPEQDAATLIVVQHQRPDRFFSAHQQARLQELMARWRAARDAGSALPPSAQAELDALAEAEVQASSERTAALIKVLGQ
jgi:hypothetical protein